MTQDTKKQFEKQLIQYGLKNNYIEKEKDGTLKFVGSKNQNTLYPLWWEIEEGEVFIWTNNNKEPISKNHTIYKKEIDFIQEQISKYNIYEGEINEVKTTTNK